MPVRFRILAAEGAQPGTTARPSVERLVDLADGLSEVRLGRRADLELPLPFPTLSSVHARLVREGEAFWLEDAGSTNGTSLDGLRLDAGERRPVEAGAELRLADVRVRFEGRVAAAGGAGAPAVEGTGTIARRLVGDLLAGAREGVPALAVVRGATARSVALVELGRAYVAGRAETCALPLDVSEVSREHAAFVREAAGVLVRDLGSKNGVVVSGARIEGERRLADGDVVELGPVVVRLNDPIERYLQELARAPEPSQAEARPPDSTPAPEPSPVPEPLPASSPSPAPRLPVVVAAIVLFLVAVASGLLLLGS